MERPAAIPCSACDHTLRPGDPFCLECGEPSPMTARPGRVSVEAQEVASAALRGQITDTLRSWFPSLDRFRVEESLRNDWTTVVRGVDEETADRMIASLKKIGVAARVTSGQSTAADFLNRGLAVTALALVALPFVGALTGFFLVLVGAGAPIAGAVLKRRRRAPLVSAVRDSSTNEAWRGLARRYVEAVRRSEPEDAAALKEIALSAFEVTKRLSESSVAAEVAGEEEGPLSELVRESVDRAAQIAVATAQAAPERKERLRKELSDLQAAVTDTDRWFRNVDGKTARSAGEVTDELQAARRRIDSVLSEVGCGVIKSAEVGANAERLREE